MYESVDSQFRRSCNLAAELKFEGMVTTKYRCYLLDAERIAGVEIIECADDAGAVIEADRILAGSPYKTAEVWNRQHKVSILSRNDPTAGVRQIEKREAS